MKNETVDSRSAGAKNQSDESAAPKNESAANDTRAAPRHASANQIVENAAFASVAPQAINPNVETAALNGASAASQAGSCFTVPASELAARPAAREASAQADASLPGTAAPRVHSQEAAAPSETSAASTRVCAIVVTFNRRDLLRECLDALHKQTRAVGQILVVDNASSDGTRAMLESEFPAVRVLALAENVGGAGGFHAGMEAAYAAGFDWLWLMDDDGQPAKNCLEKLLAHAAPSRVLAPLQRDASGRFYGIGRWRNVYVDVTEEVARRGAATTGAFLFAFVGPLIPRAAIDKAGLPNREFFIWFDDYEYALRLHRAGVRVVAVPDAIFHHDLGGVTRTVRLLGKRALRNQQPAWKTYYGTRNHLYTVTRTRRNARELLWYGVQQAWLLLGDMAFEPDRKLRAQMRFRGLRDGALGRLGKRV